MPAAAGADAGESSSLLGSSPGALPLQADGSSSAATAHLASKSQLTVFAAAFAGASSNHIEIVQLGITCLGLTMQTE